MIAALLFALSLAGVDAHGYLSSPLPRSAIPTGTEIGPKTPLPVQASTWSSCSSTAQPDLGKGSRGYATFPPGGTMVLTWTITLQHIPDDLNNTGVTVYWRNNSNASDSFVYHNVTPVNSLDSGANGNHSLTVPLPSQTLDDGTLLWLWVSIDGGYYFGCADFKLTVNGSSSAPTPSTPSANSEFSAAPLFTLLLCLVVYVMV